MTKRICGKLVRKANNGADRGTCTKPKGHRAQCRSGRCSDCGILISTKNSPPSVVAKGSGKCSRCQLDYEQRKRDLAGCTKRRRQTPGQRHEFPCGCSGTLPEKRGQSNQFAVASRHGSWSCRVLSILNSSQKLARDFGYAPIDPNTSHSVIRKLMEEPNCERCQQPLSWELGAGKTPHLHHDHESGEIFGFTHPRCNPQAMEIEIERLKNENHKLRAAKFAA